MGSRLKASRANLLIQTLVIFFRVELEPEKNVGSADPS